jgi:hypothetical protein
MAAILASAGRAQQLHETGSAAGSGTAKISKGAGSSRLDWPGLAHAPDDYSSSWKAERQTLKKKSEASMSNLEVERSKCQGFGDRKAGLASSRLGVLGAEPRITA